LRGYGSVRGGGWAAPAAECASEAAHVVQAGRRRGWTVCWCAGGPHSSTWHPVLGLLCRRANGDKPVRMRNHDDTASGHAAIWLVALPSASRWRSIAADVRRRSSALKQHKQPMMFIGCLLELSASHRVKSRSASPPQDLGCMPDRRGAFERPSAARTSRGPFNAGRSVQLYRARQRSALQSLSPKLFFDPLLGLTIATCASRGALAPVKSGRTREFAFYA
jgi:hypothetical protein